ncbi:MAG: SRPBCC family protein [Bacteroidia bacterium]|nr:SRPBCC family protein [Bacteroidia bacterium]
MKVLKVIGILLLVIVALGLIASLVLPKEMNVNVEETIEAPIDVVWDNMNSFQKADKWSPWYELDEDMKVKFEGEEGTVGSSYSWNGNSQVQQGTQTYTAIDNDNYSTEVKVVHSWGEGVAKTHLEDLGDGKVKVVYSYHEEKGIPGNLFSTLMDAEGMLTEMQGKAYAKLSEIAVAAAAEVPAPELEYEVQQVDRPAMNYIGNRGTVAFADMHTYFMENMPKLGQAAGEDAPCCPSALYWSWDMEGAQSEMTAAMPVNMDAAPEGFEMYSQDSGQYLMVEYYGNYDQSEKAHTSIGMYMEANNIEMSWPVIEEYVTDPGNEPDTSKWLTRILYPIAANDNGEASE